MLECRACFTRYVRAICNISTTELITKRSFTTARALGVSTLKKNQLTHNGNGQTNDTLSLRRPALARTPEETAKGIELAKLRAELKYLNDPLKLADHVKYVLDAGKVDKALALVRLSTKSIENIVSWNHVIDWQMRAGRVNAAFDTYNELKKRGQHPDSHTFLLLLRGLVPHVHYPGALGKALVLYHSMNSPNSKVTRTIIHTNAVLKICARAKDLESLWDILTALPERGPNAADSWTYTIIINSLRWQAEEARVESMSLEEDALRKDRLVVHGRRMWPAIVARWQNGDLAIDEELICAMGRLLLSGARTRDWDDILTLLHQSMNVPRLLPKLGTAARMGVTDAGPRPRAPYVLPDMKNETSEIVDELDENWLPGTEFDPLDASPLGPTAAPRGSRRTRIRSYARPGPATLSLVLDACHNIVSKRTAQQYWEHLTDPSTHAVSPDINNVNSYLKILRQSRSSAEALSVIHDDMPRWNLRPTAKTIHLAMATCVRDANNRNAFDHASRILDIMQSSPTSLDVWSLKMYMQVANRSDSDPILLRALERMESHVRNLNNMLYFGRHTEVPLDQKSQEAEKAEAIQTLREMLSAYSKVLRDGQSEPCPLPQEAQDDLRLRYKRIDALLSRRAGKEARRKRALEELARKVASGETTDDMTPERQRELAAETARHQEATKDRDPKAPLRSPRTWRYALNEGEGEGETDGARGGRRADRYASAKPQQKTRLGAYAGKGPWRQGPEMKSAKAKAKAKASRTLFPLLEEAGTATGRRPQSAEA